MFVRTSLEGLAKTLSLLGTPNLFPPFPFAKINQEITAIKAVFKIDSDTQNHNQILKQFHIQLDDRRALFRDFFEPDHIMTYPVKLNHNENYCIDLCTLLSWWQENNANRYKNPFNPDEFVSSIQANEPLKQLIDNYVAQEVKQRSGVQNTLIECSKLKINP